MPTFSRSWLMKMQTVFVAGQLAQGLAHQAGLQADMAVAHLALNFGAGHHGGNRVDNDCVNRAGAHKGLANFHGLFTGVRLADQ